MFFTKDNSDVIFPFAVFLGFLYVLSGKFKRKRFPPGPMGVPILGYVPFIGHNTTKTFMKLGKKYGPIFSVKMGDQNWVVLNDYETIHEALVKRGDVFSGRPHVHMYHAFTKGKGIGISEGPFWKEQRKFGVQTLKRFGFRKVGMEELVAQEIEYFLDEIASKNGAAFDCHGLLSLAVSNVICQMTIGRRYHYDDTKFTNMLLRMNAGFGEKLDGKLFHIMVIASFTRFLPVFWGSYNRFVKARKDVVEHVEQVIDEHKATYDPNNIRDFVDEFIKEMKAREGRKSTFDDNQLMLYVVDLFVAGTETTSTSLRWFLLGLITFPDLQEKIFQEICQVVGESRRVSLKDQSQMHFTNSVILEVMRHRTILPIVLPHKTTKPVIFRGYHIPKGTSVIPHIWSYHFDPKYFDSPEEFRPDRFINEDGKFVPSQYVTPFSFGPRYCLGEKLARAELFLILTGIIQKFKVLPEPETKIPSFYDGVVGGVHAPHQFKVAFEPR